MTPFSGGGRLRAFLLSFTQNRLLIILLAVLLPVLVWLNILSALQFNGRYHLPWTLADQLCQTTLPPVFLFTVAVPFVYLVCHEIKYGFSAPVVLRYPNKSALWRHQTAQIAVSALFMSLYVYLSVLSVGKTLGLGTINWSSGVTMTCRWTFRLRFSISVPAPGLSGALWVPLPYQAVLRPAPGAWAGLLL